MFGRFGERGRRAVQRAQKDAVALGHDWLGAEHLLLALLSDVGAAGAVLERLGLDRDQILADHRGVVGPCSGLAVVRPDPDALASIGIDLDEVRRCVEESFGPGALEATCAWRSRAALRLTPRAKKVIELAAKEASALGRADVEPEHLLLALTRVPESLGWKLIERRGISATRVRLAVLDRLRRPA